MESAQNAGCQLNCILPRIPLAMDTRLIKTLGLVGCFMLPGCKHSTIPDTSESTAAEETTVQSPTCPENSRVDDCCCFNRPDSRYGLNTVCASESICPRIGIECADGIEECMVFSLADEVACLLDALAHRRAETLAWTKTSRTAPWGVDKPTEDFSLHIFGDNAFMVQYHFGPERTEIKDIATRSLKPPAFFLACQSEPSLEAQMSCVENPFIEEAGTICLAGYDYPRQF